MKLFACLAVTAVTCLAVGESASAKSLGFNFNRSGNQHQNQNQNHNGFNNLFNNIQNIVNNFDDCKVDFDPCDDKKGPKNNHKSFNFNLFDCGPSNTPKFPIKKLVKCDDKPQWNDCGPRLPRPDDCGPSRKPDKYDPPTTVPTPSAVGMGIAMIGLAAARRRRRDESTEA